MGAEINTFDEEFYDFTLKSRISKQELQTVIRDVNAIINTNEAELCCAKSDCLKSAAGGSLFCCCASIDPTLPGGTCCYSGSCGIVRDLMENPACLICAVGSVAASCVVPKIAKNRLDEAGEIQTKLIRGYLSKWNDTVG